MAGYSGTPLVRKLGFKPGMKVLVLGAPDDYPAWLAEMPDGLTLAASQKGEVEAAHLFVSDSKALARQLAELRSRLRQDGMVWVSWPKKSSKVPTDVTEDTIRDLALPLGLVDVKVCAVSEVWSGLKLVIRRSERRPE